MNLEEKKITTDPMLTLKKKKKQSFSIYSKLG